MYRIDRDNNRVQKLTQTTFTKLGFEERRHLQEWIAANPDALGEDLLIIQKEFAGFDDTNERLDLLALDGHGNLVIIENKLDDSGRDVTWQALKYASYCSSLSRDQVRDIYTEYLRKNRNEGTAEERLTDFLGPAEFDELEVNKGLSQRLILVATNFRKEVTSTVMWLLNYGLRIQCFRVTPYVMGEETLLNFEQMIPVPDTEDFMIGMAAKNRDELDNRVKNEAKEALRLDFWERVIHAVSLRSDLFQNVSPGKKPWISGASGIGGVGFNVVARDHYCQAEIYIGRASAEENTYIFDHLKAQQEALEREFGEPLVWEPLEKRKACRIKVAHPVGINEQEQWPEMIDFLADRIVRIESVFRAPLAEIASEMKPT